MRTARSSTRPPPCATSNDSSTRRFTIFVKLATAYGLQASNPLVIPSRLASLVASVTIDTVVRKRVASDFDAPPALPDTMPVPDEAAPAEPETATGNLIKNPGFETGHLKPWQACSSKDAAGGAISKIAHSGKRAASTGSTSAPEVVGISCVWQLVTIPAQARAHRVYSAQHGRHESLESRPVRSAVRREGQARCDALQFARLVEALDEADDASGAVRRPAGLRYVRRNRSKERREKICGDVDRRRLAVRRCFDAHAVAAADRRRAPRIRPVRPPRCRRPTTGRTTDGDRRPQPPASCCHRSIATTAPAKRRRSLSALCRLPPISPSTCRTSASRATARSWRSRSTAAIQIPERTTSEKRRSIWRRSRV